MSLLTPEDREALQGLRAELRKIRELLEKVINKEQGVLRTEN